MHGKIMTVSLALSLALTQTAAAADTHRKNPTKKAKTPGYSVISPIFSQLVSFTLPAGFNTVYEDGNGTSYIREAVRSGESVNDWTEMVTVTGAKGLSGNPSVTPRAFAGAIAGGFQKACPGSYSEKMISEGKNERGYQQFVGVVSCGAAPGANRVTSESALIVVIRGDQDYYTIQWAERGSPSGSPIPVNHVKWNGRLAKLLPINVCPVLPGEAPPYPSCLKNK